MATLGPLVLDQSVQLAALKSACTAGMLGIAFLILPGVHKAAVENERARARLLERQRRRRMAPSYPLCTRQSSLCSPPRVVEHLESMWGQEGSLVGP